MRRYHRNSKEYKGFFVIAFVVICLIIITVIINLSLRPIVSDMALIRADAEISEVIIQTVNEVLDDSSFKYSDVVSLKYNSQGFVTSVKYDYENINALKLNCQQKLLDKIEKLGNTKLRIPFGSVFSELYSSGKGPCLRIKLSAASVPKIDVVSNFNTIGINQSVHEIRLIICAKTQIYLPPNVYENTSKQEFILAQTIIVGDIPEGYATLK